MNKILTRTTTNKTITSLNERDWRKKIIKLYKENPIPDEEVLYNLGLFINRQTMSRYLFFNEMYKNIIEIPGVIMEFGTRWGQTSALFHSLRGIYEPHNHTRKIISFDTFEGLSGVNSKDGSGKHAKEGTYSVTKNYEKYLGKIFDYHESQSPISHMKKYEIIKGDAADKLPKYMNKNEHTIIALAYFDMDLYEPTKKCIKEVIKKMPKGSILGFDELNHPGWPGETMALMDTLGIENVKIKRQPFSPFCSYIII